MPDQILSAASGNWNNTGAWDLGIVPSRGYNVKIQAGHRIQMHVTGNYQAGIDAGGTSIQVVTGGALIIPTGATITLRLPWPGNIQVNGSLVVDGALEQLNGFSLTDNGMIVWRGGASGYIFDKDYGHIFEFAIDPKEDYSRASSGGLRTYQGSNYKKRVEISFDDIGATQYNQFATIWKRATTLDFYRKATDSQRLGAFRWVDGINFAYNDWGIFYKNLYSGRIVLEEI